MATGTLGGQALARVTVINDRLVAVTVAAGTPSGEQTLILHDATGNELARTVVVGAPVAEAAASVHQPEATPTRAATATPAPASPGSATPTRTPTPARTPTHAAQRAPTAPGPTVLPFVPPGQAKKDEKPKFPAKPGNGNGRGR
jgi:hypothetical protein